MTPAELRPLRPEEFAAFRERSIDAFVDALAGAERRSPAEIREDATGQFDRLMPRGLDTENQWVFHVLGDDGTVVGLLWLGGHFRRADAMYVNNVEIDPEHRGRGFGKRAMLAAEAVARDEGYVAIGLNVFGQNEKARHLYGSLGYRVVATQMSKDLVSSGQPSTPSGEPT
jgi:ribosomal protein S18 acetylase RimI-like enzyme